MRRGGRKREREREEKNRRVRRAGERTAECGETSAGKSQLRGMSVSTVEGQRIERGRRVERVESGTRQTCLAITEKLKRSRQPLCFLVAADSFGTTIVSSFLVSSAIPLVSFEKRVHLSRLLQEIFVSTISDALHLSTSRNAIQRVLHTLHSVFSLSFVGKKRLSFTCLLFLEIF